MARAGLNKEAVVEAASRLADAEGLEAVTLARLAKELKVKAPSLYNHVDGLSAVLRELSLRGLREANARMSRAAVGLSREQALIAVGIAYHRFALEHPGLYGATLKAPAGDDTDLEQASQETLDTLKAVLAGYGLEGDDALHAIRGLRAIIQGFVLLEFSGGFGLPLDIEESLVRLLTAFSDGLAKTGV
jgi:AcrR family transcriptional regulator